MQGKRHRKLPGDEEDLALAAVVDGDEVEIEDGVAAVVVGQGGGHLIVTLAGGADLVHGEELRSFVDFEHDVAVHLLPLHLHERILTFIRHTHPRRRLLRQNRNHNISEQSRERKFQRERE